MVSQWCHNDLTRVGHICPFCPLQGRDIYVLPVLYKGETYMSFQSSKVLPSRAHECKCWQILLKKLIKISHTKPDHAICICIVHLGRPNQLNHNVHSLPEMSLHHLLIQCSQKVCEHYLLLINDTICIMIHFNQYLIRFMIQILPYFSVNILKYTLF